MKVGELRERSFFQNGRKTNRTGTGGSGGERDGGRRLRAAMWSLSGSGDENFTREPSAFKI